MLVVKLLFSVFADVNQDTRWKKKRGGMEGWSAFKAVSPVATGWVCFHMIN